MGEEVLGVVRPDGGEVTDEGIDIIGIGPDEFSRIMQADLVKFGKIVRDEIQKWARVVKASGAQAR